MDEFYIENTNNYQVKSRLHDDLIIGYNHQTDKYILYGYSKIPHLSQFEIPCGNIDNAGESEQQTNQEAVLIIAKAKIITIELDLCCIKEKILDYLKEKPIKINLHTNFSEQYGIGCLDCIAEYLKNCVSAYEDENIWVDLRVTRMLWEHKKCMLERIIAVEKKLCITSNLSSEYKRVVDLANILRLKTIKYSIIKNKETILTSIKIVYKIKEEEKYILQKFCEILG